MRLIAKLAVCAALAVLFVPADIAFAGDFGKTDFSNKCKVGGGTITAVNRTTLICHHKNGSAEECHFASVGWCTDMDAPAPPSSTGAFRHG